MQCVCARARTTIGATTKATSANPRNPELRDHGAQSRDRMVPKVAQSQKC